MSVKRINQFPEGSGSLSSDDVFLFMDDPSGNKATKKISLSQLSEAIGVIAVSGASADTGDITFNGSTISTANTNQGIILNPNGSGEVNINDFVFNSNGTVSLPSNTLNAGSYSIDIKSSDYAELWFQSGPSGTFGSYLNNPSRNEASYIWTASEGAFIQNYRPNDGTNPNWNHVWQFDNSGTLQFPDNLAIGNSIISNMVVNSLGEGTYLSTGSQIEVVGAKTVISNGVTNSVGGDGGSSVLTAQSITEVGSDHVILATQVINSLDNNSVLTSQNQLEVNSSGVLIGNKVTNTLDGNSITSFNGWAFDATDHNLTLPRGGSLSETNNTVSIAPPTAASGQSLVIRPTAAIWAISSSNYIEYGNPITIVVTLQTWAYFGTVNYTISGPGVTSQSLGRALTGKLTFVSTTGPDAESITWTIPANSNISEFTLTLTSVDGTKSTNEQTQNDPALYYDFEENAMPIGQFITVTNNGVSSSEHSHVHLLSGNPSTVDLYLGDDDQYVKIEKNAGDVIVGTNLNTRLWTFGTDGELTLPTSGSITFPNNTTQTSAGIPSNTGLVPNSVSITNMVSISQANYDALVTKNSTTLYVIS
jgi:hypothetical protein